MEIWEIIIYCDNGPAYTILGDGDTFKAELVAWQKYQRGSAVEVEEYQDSYQSTSSQEIRVLEGLTYDVARLPAILGYRFSEVQGMTIMRIR